MNFSMNRYQFGWCFEYALITADVNGDLLIAAPFHLAMANMGDIDKDKYSDIAIRDLYAELLLSLWIHKS